MKKYFVLTGIIVVLLFMMFSSCSKKRNINPFTPGELFTATSSPVIATVTRTMILSATNTPILSATKTRTISATFTRTPLVSTATQTPIATTPAVSSIIYDGDTIGSRLVDGTVTNGSPGTLTETTGGNPGNLMRLTYTTIAGWWQPHRWTRAASFDIGANGYLIFNVRQAPASPNAVNQFTVRIGGGANGAVAYYLVEGGVIDTSWKTAKIPLADILAAGQTQIDYLEFIGNWNQDYTVDIDNVRLEVAIPTATPTITITFTITNTINVAWSSTATPTVTLTIVAYIHPGAWSSITELNFVKTQVATGQEPWTQELNNLIGKTGGTSSGINFNGQTQNSCTQQGSVQTDSELVYSNALAWYLTGTQSYYTKAMTILANYAGIQGFQSNGCFAGQSALNVGWFGVLFANACELLRTSPNWTAANTTTYVNMFKTGFYPKLNTMSPDNGNIDLTQIDAMFCMAVFCDDRTEWSLAVARYQARMPAAFISSTWTGVPAVNKPAALGTVNTNNCGGAVSPPIDFWYCPTSWVAGLEQETCRDNGHHVQFAVDAAFDCAEIDYHQGSPNTLYASYQTYLLPALELLAHQFVSNSTCGACNGTWDPQNQKLIMFEMGYNHYGNRIGLASAVAGDPLYYTKSWITTLRANAGATRLQFNIAYETLTHAGVN